MAVSPPISLVSSSQGQVKNRRGEVPRKVPLNAGPIMELLCGMKIILYQLTIAQELLFWLNHLLNEFYHEQLRHMVQRHSAGK